MDVFPIKSEKVKYHKTQKLFWNRRKIFAFCKSKSEKKKKNNRNNSKKPLDVCSY